MVKKDKQAIIFDMDGVLVDSEPVINIAAVKGLGEYGVDAKPEDFIPFIGAGEDKYIGGVAEKYGLTYQPEMKKRVYEIYLDIVEKELRIYEGVNELLNQLSTHGVKMVLASSTDRIKIDANLRVAGIPQSKFVAIISGDDVVEKKPSPEIYLKTAETIKISPLKCVVIEDAVNGVKAAKAAGMKCIALTTSFKEDILIKENPNFICHSIKDVFDTLENMGWI